MTSHNKSLLSWAHPLVRDWFISKFGAPTEPQIEGWPPILAGKTTLISAPTGSGKTLAAFLVYIDQLVRKAVLGDLNNETEVLYVSPLKALSNDVQKNLLAPLAEIQALAAVRGIMMGAIDVAVRTGDTLARERQTMLKKPPHILVTTPESLYILLTAAGSRAILKSVKTVIIDEIHAVANDKRGAHLALSLERLQVLTEKKIPRIGLSATQKPMTTMATLLAGNRSDSPAIIQIGHARQLDLAIEVPASELSPVASHEMWDEIYNRLQALSETHRSTLVFVNTRKLAERIAHHLAERIGADKVAAHHGSLSRKLRLQAETKLKNGELKLLVATASLELGIDIGAIDLVCQIGSPRAIAAALQRVGRAGHWHGAISKGRFFATTRDELVECAALVYAIRQGDLDQLLIPEAPIDVLAQQIVASVATEDWQEDDLFHMIKHAYHYANLSRETFNDVLDMLSDGIAASRGRFGAYLFRDRVHHSVKARRGSRMIAITNGGTIPDNGLFTVIAEPNGVMVGTLDEDFAVESNRGDIILLGTTSWQIKRVETARGQVLVEDAHGAPPSVPFWRGEAPARTKELSFYVSELRQTVSDLLKHCKPDDDIHKNKHAKKTLTWLRNHCGLDQSGAEQLIAYILAGRAVLGAVPTQKTIIAERFFDEAGGMQLIIHAPFGARINKAWGLALRKKFCRSFNFELQAAATDDGLNIALAEQHSFPLSDVFQFLNVNTIKDVLTQAVLQSPLFNTRWRWVATRSLALKRFGFGKKTPPNILRMLSDDLLAAVFPDAAACQDNLGGRDIELPNHPLINEAMKDILTEALDIDGLITLLKNISNEEIICLAVDTPVPSLFSHEILNANPYAYLDDAPLEERRARAVEMRRILPESVLQEVGKLDIAAIQEVKEQAWPDVRNKDELHDVLQTLIVFPEDLIKEKSGRSCHLWHEYFTELQQEKRATIAIINDKKYWVAAEKINIAETIYPNVIWQKSLKAIITKIFTQEEAIVELIRGWLLHTSVTHQEELQTILQLPANDIEIALLKLEASGFILRGHFQLNDKNKIEWCERRLLQRIHRLTLGKLRKEIEPVTAAQFVAWLLEWQHAAKGTELQGEQGLLAVIKQLQGFEIPANAWEKHIFAKRVKDYQSSFLDQLCLSGIIGWGRISPHPAMKNEVSTDRLKKRIMPTSVAPITFFVREESNWMPDVPIDYQAQLTVVSSTAKNIYDYLKQNGASFFNDIQRDLQLLKTELENALWELVAVGFVTADGFNNLRAFIDPRRRLNKLSRHRVRSYFSSGRWSLLHRRHINDHQQQLEAVCWMLLNRYGVVFRDLITREKNVPSWRELLITLRRLEDRGEIRGGRFVSGFLGEQFALPHAVQSLRLMRNRIPADETLTISSVDPLNLVGIILPGVKISAMNSRKQIVLQNGNMLV